MKFIPSSFTITSCGLRKCNSKMRTFSLIANKRGTSGVFRRNLIKNIEHTNLTTARFRIIFNNLHAQSQLCSARKNLTEKLVKCLEELKNTEYSNLTMALASSHKEENFKLEIEDFLLHVENVKNLLFQVGEKRINFTEEDKERIECILHDVLDPCNVIISDSSAAKEEGLPALRTKEELVECLQDMIEYIEYTDPNVVRGKNSLDLIPEVGRKQKDFTEKFVKCIEELKHTDFSKSGVALASHDMVASFLCLLFEVGRKRINFTEVEKRQIGNLLADVIKPIKMNFKFSPNVWTRSDIAVFLVRRSVFQFLVEDFGQFPARSSTLKNELEKAGIEESLAKLDSDLEDWWDPDDFEEELTDVEDVGPLPDTHTWWSYYYSYYLSDSDEDGDSEKAAPRTPAPVGLPRANSLW